VPNWGVGCGKVGPLMAGNDSTGMFREKGKRARESEQNL
jgi:hypothetical protein